MKYTIHTDGACWPNPGPGGWAAIVTDENRKETVLKGSSLKTTNNRMEIQAVIEGLKATEPSSTVLVITDSKYVQYGVNQWIHSWAKKGWMTSKTKPNSKRKESHPVLNRDQWEEILKLKSERHVTVEWVKGHSGDPMNERCDELANEAAGIVGDGQFWRH